MLHSRHPSRDQRFASRLLLSAAAAIVFAVCWRYDTQIFHAVFVGAARRAEVESGAWYQFFRGIGFLPTWLAIGGAIMLAGRQRKAVRDGALIILSAAVAGGIAEILKPLVARYRPEVSDGVHKYRSLATDPTGPYGLASSHAAVAFGAAVMLLFIYPRAGVLALILAAGCAWTRLLSGAHYASDVFIGLLLGYACARLLRPKPSRSGGVVTGGTAA